LVLSACQLTTFGLKSDLLNSVDPIPALASRASSGGRLNVYRAITACAGATTSPLTLSVTPGSLKLDLSGTVTSTIVATSTAGMNLAAFGLPAGVTATFNPPSISAGTGSSTLTLTASANADQGAFLVGIAGSSGGTSRSTGLSIIVGSLPISPGQTITGTLAP